MIFREFSHDGNAHRILIEPDPDPQSPRDWDNFGHLDLDHRRYSLPKEGTPESLGYKRENCIILPVWGYDHGGLSCKAGDRTYPYDEPWDSGQLGIIWAPRNVLGRSDAEIIEILTSEVAVFDFYLRGEVYGYVIEELATFANSIFGDRDEWIQIDSCWGLYGLEEAKRVALEAAGLATDKE